MKPKPLSSLNHLTVPVAIAFPPASIVLRTRRLLSKGYDRWHCDVGRITRPDLATVAASVRVLVDRQMADVVYTIGHSTRSLDELASLLSQAGVGDVVDVRSAPGSRRNP